MSGLGTSNFSSLQSLRTLAHLKYEVFQKSSDAVIGLKEAFFKDLSIKRNNFVSIDRKILEKVLSGLSDRNIRFRDLSKLLSDFRFIERIKGGHHIFFKDGIEEILNLQPLKDGKAKAYQVKQVRTIILKYKFHKDGRDV